MKYRKFFNTKSLFLLSAIVLFYTASCSIGGFSRSTAARAIETDGRYPTPATMTIDVRGRLSNAAGKAWQISKDDTAEAAATRAKADFATRQPQIVVAEHLGYIKLSFDEPELSGKEMGMPYELYAQNMGVWNFKVHTQITDKGRALWQNLNLETDEESLPLASREAPEITGISDQNQTMKKVDFTYRWKPTPLGEAFDSNTSTFAALPKELQESLKKVQPNIFGGGSNNIANFNSTRQGVAYFQKFDDGWRLGNLAFL